MKNIKYYISIIFVILLLTGCSKSDLTLSIDSDDNVFIKHTITTDEETYNVIKDLISNDQDTFEKGGFTINKIKDNDYTGYEIIGKIGNLKNLSYGNKNSSLELSNYSSKDLNVKDMFYNRNRFFYTSYLANITIDLTNINDASNNLPIFNKTSHSDKTTQDNDSLNKNVHTTFILDSAYKVFNANNDSIEGNKYIWNLTYGKINSINFEIYKINYSTIMLISIIFFIGIIVLFLYVKSKIAKNSYNRINIKYSLDRENRTIERGKKRDDSRPNLNEKNRVLNAADSINSRLNGNTSLGVYSNQKTLEELKYEFEKNDEDESK